MSMSQRLCWLQVDAYQRMLACVAATACTVLQVVAISGVQRACQLQGYTTSKAHPVVQYLAMCCQRRSQGVSV